MEPLDLTNCDREPIHIPGSIQPHGALLVADPVSEAVLQAAGDLPGLLGARRPPLGLPVGLAAGTAGRRPSGTTSATSALANVTSAGALMPERSGELDKLLVMVFMVIGVPPFSMVGRHDGHACSSNLRVSL